MKHTLAVIAPLLWLNCIAAFAEGAPKIQFDKTTYDFGTTSLVQSVTGTFTFQNAGDAELLVRPPKPTCGCTVAGVKPDRLQPGEKGELVFTMNLANIRGPTQKAIIVPTNDPQQPELKLDIKANVKPVLEVTPPQAKFGDLHVGDSGSTTVTVKRVDGKKLSVKTIEVADPAIRVRYEPVDGDAQAARVLFDLQAASEPRWYSGSVQLITDDSQGAAVAIPVSARFVGDVVIAPEQLVWNILDEGEPAEKPDPHTRTLTISTGKTDQNLELRKVSSDVKALGFEVITVATGKQFNVVATLDGLPTEPLAGSIRIETNLATQPNVVVPVMIKVVRLPKP